MGGGRLREVVAHGGSIDDNTAPTLRYTFLLGICTLYKVNSLIATTSRKRPLYKLSFCFSVKHCFKNSLVSDLYLNFLSDRDHFLGQKFDIFFRSLFPVSDHPA